jgi:hypothetical protein
VLQLAKLKTHYNDDAKQNGHDESLRLSEEIGDLFNWTLVILVAFKAVLDSLLHQLRLLCFVKDLV